jgi:hypothetical protein
LVRVKNTPIDVWRYVDMPENGDPDPCWNWVGTVGGRIGDQRGYFSVDGIKWLAYRLVYVLMYGPLEEGEVVRHKCDNPLCCNPYHLESGNQTDNENDKYDRSRYGFPVKLVESVIDWSDKGLTQQAIAEVVTERFGIVVTQQRVHDIVNGHRRARQVAAYKEKRV